MTELTFSTVFPSLQSIYNKKLLGTNKKCNLESRGKLVKRDSQMMQILKLDEKDLKMTMKNMLRDLHEKVNIIGEEIGDMKTMGKDKMEGLELKNIIS